MFGIMVFRRGSTRHRYALPEHQPESATCYCVGCGDNFSVELRICLAQFPGTQEQPVPDATASAARCHKTGPWCTMLEEHGRNRLPQDSRDGASALGSALRKLDQ